MKYVELVIDHNSDKTDRFYTYGCGFSDISVGQKVIVPFAMGNKLKDAYVFSVSNEPGADIKGLKYVDSVDASVKLPEEAIKTCLWMKKRYACKYIDAVNCFAPSGSSSKTGKDRNPVKGISGEAQDIQTLTSEQKAAMDRIIPYIRGKRHNIFLLHGVTGSGKTEVYMQSIEACLLAGRKALMLVPEISLTKQIIERFIGRFGRESLAVLHSRLSPGEKYDEWMRIRNGKVKIVIGARSAVFAPLTNIGVIILDEEHEATYKSDKTPKYDTVEIAIKRVKSQREKGIVILGSATPSVVSYYRACEGTYEKIELVKRYNETKLPDAVVVDMRAELKAGNKSVISRLLFEEAQKNLSSGRQIILFLNRRGYSTFVNCRECGYVMKCRDCGISLTYHKSNGLAVCHYCGRGEALYETCPDCGGKYIRYFGAGTEKVEEEARLLFPEYETERLDLDAIKRKGDLDKVLENFRKGKTKILIGTQLVAKGLDFHNVGLVGVISADASLNIPDFRSAERSFQLITQAAGRAGRGESRGKAVIQTYTPDHYSITAACRHDYAGFYESEITFRDLLGYPPFADLIQAVALAASEEEAKAGSERVFSELSGRLSREDRLNVFRPQALPFFKQSGERYQILIRSAKGKRNLYMEALADIKKSLSYEKTFACKIGIDVNPYNFL